MALTNTDNLINAMCNNRQKLPFAKSASINTQIAGYLTSYWRATEWPATPAIPSSVASCNNTTAGGLIWDNPTGGNKTYISKVSWLPQGQNVSFELHDRLAHMGGLSGTVTTAQTVGLDLHTTGLGGTDNITVRKGASDFSDVMWFLEWHTSTGATARTATITYTNDSGTTGQTTTCALHSSVTAHTMIPIYPTTGNIRSIQSIQLSGTTGTAGAFGVVATIKKMEIFNPLQNNQTPFNFTASGLEEIPDSACIMICGVPSISTISGLSGSLTLVQG